MEALRVLIIDDETPLLDLLKRYLERLGYQVETAENPRSAWERFEADPQRYSIVLTDLTLPGMNGEELADKMRTKNPRVPIIVSSGYPFEPREQGIYFLQKPYLPKMLAELFHNVLSHESPRNSEAM